MCILVFYDHTSFENVYHKNALVIYEKVLEKIRRNIDAKPNQMIRIATIRLSNLEYHIDISRANFHDILKRASQVFKEHNETQKSEECLSLLEELR